MVAKYFDTTDDAVADIADGATILVGGFVSAGTPSNLIRAVRRSGRRNLTAVANNIGLGDLLDELCEDRQLARVIATFAIRASGSRRSRFETLYHAGEVELELVPQGTLIERLRAGGAGLGGVLTRTGLGTMMAEGKQTIELDGEEWLLERPLRGDVALLKAWRADRLGNLQYRLAGPQLQPGSWRPPPTSSSPKSRRSSSPARSPADQVGNTRHLRRPDRPVRADPGPLGGLTMPADTPPTGLSRELIALRVARELEPGSVVNLGIGLPTLVAGFVEPTDRILFQAENGILGYSGVSESDFDADLINAGGPARRSRAWGELLRHSGLVRDDSRRPHRRRGAGRLASVGAGRLGQLVRPVARRRQRRRRDGISRSARAN